MSALWRAAPLSVQGNFFEFVIREAIHRYAYRGTTAIDAGADGGAHTKHMAEAVGNAGRVVAFEPNPNMAPYVRKVCEPYPWVEVLEVALSERTGTGTFYVATESALCSLHKRPHQGMAVAREISQHLSRLDDVAELRDAGDISVIKADVEGEELALLRGALETIRKHRPVILIEIDWAFSFSVDWTSNAPGEQATQAFLQWLNAVGYVPVDFFGRTIDGFEPNAWNVALVPSQLAGPDLSAFLLDAAARFFDEFRQWRLY